ncbi:uncharacterized protein FIESC28_00656 [Fusarium coffeatum]|uniref:Protein kinase domain-containing protein n=1 Tax=Fusarium coffeatum TaxID=231269 RepID=A0A366SB63_9HYPO|nr:uncharacterized protein FIESC28_00656 [Fusarium coffeatum]RBR26539.1 hypothetical protein FIESC28_00656 [Fusarium coffeatum]
MGLDNKGGYTRNKRHTAQDLRKILAFGEQPFGRAIHDSREEGNARGKPPADSSSSIHSETTSPKATKHPKKVTFAPAHPTIPKAASKPSANSSRSASQAKEVGLADQIGDDGIALRDHVDLGIKPKFGDNVVMVAYRITSYYRYKNHPVVFLWDVRDTDAKDQVRIALRIDDEHFVKFIRGYQVSTGFVIAYESFGVSLVEFAMCRGFEEPVLVCILRQIISGLEYLDQEGIDHPKLSCSNVVVDASGQVKICMAISYPLPTPYRIDRKAGGQHHCREGKTDNLISGLYGITATLLRGYDGEGFQDDIDFSRWGDPHLPEFLNMMRKLQDKEIDASAVLTTSEKLRKIRQGKHELMKRYNDRNPPMEFLQLRARFLTRWLVMDMEDPVN